MNRPLVLLLFLSLTCLAGCAAREPRTVNRLKLPEARFLSESAEVRHQRSRWFDGTESICTPAGAAPLLKQWEADLLALCRRTSSGECRVEVSQVRRPPANFPEATNFCELEVKTVAGSESMNFNANFTISSDAGPEKATKILSYQKNCLDRRLNQIADVGRGYQQFVAHVRNRVSPSMMMQFTFCAHPITASANLNPRFAEFFGRGIPQIIGLHEGTHFLGSFSELGSEPLKSYRFALVTKDRFEEVRIPIVGASPKMNQLYPELKGNPLYSQADRYFSKVNDNDFYMVLDEWNAYNNQLYFDLAMNQDCKKHTDSSSDSLRSAAEFIIYTSRYIDRFGREIPKILASKEVRRFIDRQLGRTLAIWKRRVEFPCQTKLLPSPLIDEVEARARALEQLSRR